MINSVNSRVKTLLMIWRAYQSTFLFEVIFFALPIIRSYLSLCSGSSGDLGKKNMNLNVSTQSLHVRDAWG